MGGRLRILRNAKKLPLRPARLGCGCTPDDRRPSTVVLRVYGVLPIRSPQEECGNRCIGGSRSGIPIGRAGRTWQRESTTTHFRASQAARVANFSSWVQGEPRGLPSSLMKRVSAGGLRRRVVATVARSSRSLIVVTSRLARAQAWSNASRKNSPSAVWMMEWEARILGSSGSGRPEARRSAARLTF